MSFENMFIITVYAMEIIIKKHVFLYKYQINQ